MVKMSAGQEPEEAGQLAGKQCAHAKKHLVLKSTVDKWISENDKGLNTSVWLRYDTDTSTQSGRQVDQKKITWQHCM